MKVRDLVRSLKKYDDEANVDINNGMGAYANIGEVGIVRWKERDGFIHESVEIKTISYNSNDSKVN